MRIALYQMKMAEQIQENQIKTLVAIEEAASNGADLIVFPEIQYSPFFPQYEKRDVSHYVMSINHEFIRMIQEACAKNKIMAAPNIYLLENGKTYDATLLINKAGEILGLQKMVHIAQAECFFEKDYYTEADDGFKVFDTELGRLGIVVCFDRHYPESIRTEALKGADLILIPTANTTDEPSEMFEWEIRVQAFQSSVAIAMCNRTGLEDRMDFSGESIVVGADGNVIAKADADEQILYADIELGEVKNIRDGKNYTKLRRTEYYA